MGSTSTSVIQINENAGNMPMNSVAYRTDELRARHEELPFLETIVGRRGSLRGILSLAEAVAPTNMTVLIAGECGRNWHRKGSHRSRDSRVQSPPEPKSGEGELRRNPRRPSGKRALRARTRSLYRRRQLSCRPLRVGGSRHSVPR
jgi:hypothetical protein